MVFQFTFYTSSSLKSIRSLWLTRTKDDDSRRCVFCWAKNHVVTLKWWVRYYLRANQSILHFGKLMSYFSSTISKSSMRPSRSRRFFLNCRRDVNRNRTAELLLFKSLFLAKEFIHNGLDLIKVSFGLIWAKNIKATVAKKVPKTLP